MSVIIEGATEKVPKVLMPLKSMYNKGFCFDEQKWMFLKTFEKC